VTRNQELEADLYQNKAPKTIFGPIINKLHGTLSKLHNEKLYDLHYFIEVVRLLVTEVVLTSNLGLGTGYLD
jgi:hypothetical protein